MPSFDEYIEEIRGIFDIKYLTNNGPKLREFQQKLQNYLGAENVSLFVNGHMALEMAIQAFDFPEGSEIITTPFTFISTTHAIVRNDLRPVFCDIDPDTYCIDANKIEALITDKTVAIIPVHVYGNICDVDRIQQIADRYGLKVIYDAAHAFGEKIEKNGELEPVVNFGDASMLSFHATKVFNTLEGGGICTDSQSVIHKLDDLKNFGIRGPEDTVAIGANAKMNELQAAMGLCNLRHIDDEISKRKKVYEKYVDLLGGRVKLGSHQNRIKRNYGYVPVLFANKKNRDKTHELLRNDEDVIARKYFYPISQLTDAYKNTYHGETPIAEDVSERVLALPIYADLDVADITRICEVVDGAP
jgi:dTDP-4-amino-4,6-dideoxygalactose transaminase